MPARYELMNQRTVPGITPSPESYELAVRVLRGLEDRLPLLGADEMGLPTTRAEGLTTMTTSTHAPTAPRRPALDRDIAMRLAATEYDRYVAALRQLAPADWHRPTDCSPAFQSAPAWCWSAKGEVRPHGHGSSLA